MFDIGKLQLSDWLRYLVWRDPSNAVDQCDTAISFEVEAELRTPIEPALSPVEMSVFGCDGSTYVEIERDRKMKLLFAAHGLDPEMHHDCRAMSYLLAAAMYPGFREKRETRGAKRRKDAAYIRHLVTSVRASVASGQTIKEACMNLARSGFGKVTATNAHNVGTDPLRRRGETLARDYTRHAETYDAMPPGDPKSPFIL